MADDHRPIEMPQMRAPRGPGLVRFEWDDVSAMCAAGLFGETERVELIEGELRIMPDEGPLHLIIVQILQRWFLKNMGEDWELYSRGSLKVLDTATYPIPDISILKAGFKPNDCTVALAELIIEVSDTTLKFDLGQKCKLYAKAGAKEVWVIDANARCIIVHRQPDGETFASIQTIEPGTAIAPLCAVSAGFDPAALPRLADIEE